MSFQRWIALGLIASCAGVAFAQTPTAPNPQPETEQAQPQQTTTEPAPAPQQQATAPADQQDLCARANSREERDLCQQWRMAEASEELAAIADRQFWATTIEIGALLITVMVGVIAVLQTQAQIKRQQHAAAQQLLADKIHNRAYLTLERSDLVDAVVARKPKCSVVLKNTGLTPARDVRVIAGFSSRVAGTDRPPELTHDMLPDPSQREVGRDGVFAVEMEMNVQPLTAAQMTELAAGRILIDFRMLVSFVDAYGESRWVRVRLESHRGANGQLVFIAAPEGNDSN